MPTPIRTVIINSRFGSHFSPVWVSLYALRWAVHCLFRPSGQLNLDISLLFSPRCFFLSFPSLFPNPPLIPSQQTVFQITPLSPTEWFAVLCFSLPVIFLDEFLKFLSRQRGTVDAFCGFVLLLLFNLLCRETEEEEAGLRPRLSIREGWEQLTMKC